MDKVTLADYKYTKESKGSSIEEVNKFFKDKKGLEHQMNPNAGRPYGGNRRVNDGSNRIEGQDRIEGVKLNVPSFKGRSDPDAYLD